MLGILLVLALVVLALASIPVARAAGRLTARTRRQRRERIAQRDRLEFDPGRERRAEQRARRLLRSCVDEEAWSMYRDLGFVRVAGRPLSDSRAGDATPYAYLIYAHKPIVAYVPGTGQLLSEYCVEFPDLGGGRTRLPASDDVLAKWMALTSDEARLIGRANMHLVGRQHDPARLRRDLWRLSEWDRRREGGGRLGARAA